MQGVNMQSGGQMHGVEQALSRMRAGGTPRQPGESSESDPLREVAQEFEALFIQQMFDAMRDTIDREDSLFYGGVAEEVFEDMLYEQYALTMARTANTGIADMIYDQFAGRSDGADAAGEASAQVRSLMDSAARERAYDAAGTQLP